MLILIENFVLVHTPHPKSIFILYMFFNSFRNLELQNIMSGKFVLEILNFLCVNYQLIIHLSLL